VQYQCPVWRYLAADQRVSAIKVIFQSDYSVRGYYDKGFAQDVRWTVPLLDGFESVALSHKVVKSFLDPGAPVGILNELRAFRPNVCLLNSYLPLLYVNALLACRCLGVPVLLRAEATDADQDRSPLKRTVRDAALRAFYTNVFSVLAIGHNSRTHYARLGLPSQRIGFSPYCVDSELLERQYTAATRGTFRRAHGIPQDAVVVLFSGKLIEKKDPLRIIEALAGVDTFRMRAIHVVMMGEGALRREIEDRSRMLSVKTHLVGFRPQESLGEVYADADLLVLPSRYSETWGLVVNEALQFGVPCIVSDRVGCHPDLVVEGVTGYVFAHGSTTALRAQILKLIDAVCVDRAALHNACRRKVEAYSSTAAAAGIVEAASMAVFDQGS